MPGETVTLQIGQCGNQVGLRFWELALRELAEHNTKGRCVCRVLPPPILRSPCFLPPLGPPTPPPRAVVPPLFTQKGGREA